MSRFDGSPVPLSYGQALAELARATNFATEAHKADVVRAIQVEHGDYVVPQEEVRAAEVERLRRLVAEQEAAKAEAAEAAELAALRRQLGLDPETGLPAQDGGTPADTPEDQLGLDPETGLPAQGGGTPADTPEA